MAVAMNDRITAPILKQFGCRQNRQDCTYPVGIHDSSLSLFELHGASRRWKSSAHTPDNAAMSRFRGPNPRTARKEFLAWMEDAVFTPFATVATNDSIKAVAVSRRACEQSNTSKGKSTDESKTTKSITKEPPAKDRLLVCGSNAPQQCTRSRVEGFYVHQPTANRFLAKAICSSQPETQGLSLSIGHVHVELLHQPRREGPFSQPKKNFRTSQT